MEMTKQPLVEEKEIFKTFMEGYIDDMLGEQEYETIYEYGPLTDKYWEAEPRILICNLEPYDEREGHVKLDMDLFREWIKVPTGKYTTKFVACLIKVLSKECKISELDFSKINLKDSLAYIETIAYMNFRVDSGIKVRADYSTIFRQVDAHKDYMRDFINCLNPKIIVLSGRASCDLLNRILDTNLNYKSIGNVEGRIFCSVRHFSRANYQEYSQQIIEIEKLNSKFNAD